MKNNKNNEFSSKSYIQEKDALKTQKIEENLTKNQIGNLDQIEEKIVILNEKLQFLLEILEKNVKNLKNYQNEVKKIIYKTENKKLNNEKESLLSGRLNDIKKQMQIIDNNIKSLGSEIDLIFNEIESLNKMKK